MSSARSLLAAVALLVILVAGSESAAEPVDRGGQWGLGAGTGGVSIIKWMSNGLALQAGTGASWYYGEEDYGGDNYDASLSIIPLITARGNLRLEGQAGVQWSRSQRGFSDTQFTYDAYSLGLGLGAEYHFDELPDLAFGVNLVGLSFTYYENQTSSGGVTTTDYPKNVSTNARFAFGATYYF